MVHSPFVLQWNLPETGFVLEKREPPERERELNGLGFLAGSAGFSGLDFLTRGVNETPGDIFHSVLLDISKKEKEREREKKKMLKKKRKTNQSFNFNSFFFSPFCFLLVFVIDGNH